MGSPKYLAATAAAALLLHCALAATVTVGSPAGGWDLTTDLSSWSSSQTFSIGDTLVFQYGSTHNVLEVTEANYDACSARNPIASYNNGQTTIILSSAAKRFFICGVANHCTSGMKIEVDVTSPATGPPSSPTPTISPPRANPNPQSPNGRGSPSPSSAVMGLKAPAMAGFLCWMLIFFAF